MVQMIQSVYLQKENTSILIISLTKIIGCFSNICCCEKESLSDVKLWLSQTNCTKAYFLIILSEWNAIEKQFSHQTFSLLISESCHLVAVLTESHQWMCLSSNKHNTYFDMESADAFTKMWLCENDKYALILIRFTFFLINIPGARAARGTR